MIYFGIWLIVIGVGGLIGLFFAARRRWSRDGFDLQQDRVIKLARKIGGGIPESPDYYRIVSLVVSSISVVAGVLIVGLNL